MPLDSTAYTWRAPACAAQVREDPGAGADVDDDIARCDGHPQRVAEALRARAVVEHREVDVRAHPPARRLVALGERGVHENAAVGEVLDAHRELRGVLRAGARQGLEDLSHRPRDREGVEHGERDARRKVPLTVALDADLVIVREAHEDVLGADQHRIGADLRGLASVVVATSR